jgi:molybdate-binding protein
MVQAGNPKQIKTITDVVEMGAAIANREVGSGSRSLLEQTLQQEKIPFQSLQGFEWIMNSHQEVGWVIASDMVDAGISTASVAIAFGLGFIPLRHSRYDLVILNEYMQEPPVQ